MCFDKNGFHHPKKSIVFHIQPYHSPEPLETTNTFTASIVLHFPEYYVIKIIQSFALSDQLLSFSNMHLRVTHFFLHYFIFLINLFIYLFIFGCFAACRLSLVAASRGYSLLQCMGFSLRWRSMGSRRVVFSSYGTWVSVVVACRLQSTGSVVVAHRLSCSVTCGIFLDQGSNPCPLHWQADF